MNIFVISPHPDDESIGCGGAIHKHVAEGDSVTVIFLTSGEQGGHGVSPEATAVTREAEAERACGILGVQQFEFWRQPDGGLAVTESLIDRLAGILQKCDRVYVTHRDESHSDHRAAWNITVQAAKRVNFPMNQVLEYEVWTPLTSMSEIIDISPYLEVKLSAIRAHESQCRVLRFDEAMKGLARYRGEMHSWPGGDYAEVFSSGDL